MKKQNTKWRWAKTTTPARAKTTPTRAVKTRPTSAPLLPSWVKAASAPATPRSRDFAPKRVTDYKTLSAGPGGSQFYGEAELSRRDGRLCINGLAVKSATLSPLPVGPLAEAAMKLTTDYGEYLVLAREVNR